MISTKDFSLGELAIVRQQLENEEQQRKLFIEKMFNTFEQDHNNCLDVEEDYDNIDCF